MSSTATRAPPQMYAFRRPRRPPAGAAPAPARWGVPVRCPAPGLPSAARFPVGAARPAPEPAALTFVMVRPARDRSGYRPWRVLLVVGVVAVGPVTARAARGHLARPRGRRPLLNHGAPPEGDRTMH